MTTIMVIYDCRVRSVREGLGSLNSPNGGAAIGRTGIGGCEGNGSADLQI